MDARSRYKPQGGKRKRKAKVRLDAETAMAEKLAALTDEAKYGIVLRAKGIVAAADGGDWIHFDYVPGEPDVRAGAPAVIGRLCVIGSKLNIPALSELFGAELA